MSTTSETMPWTNYDDAMARIRGYEGPALEQFVMRGITIVVQNFSNANYPAEKLDMLYLVMILEQLFGQRESLKRILDGEDLRW